MRRTLFLFAAVMLAALPAGAHAATITLADVTVPEGHTNDTIVVGTTLTYVAAPGEANDLSVRRAGSRLVIADAGAVISAPGCMIAVPGQVSCPASSDLIVRLGDRDDRATLSDGLNMETRTVDGGSGDDVLRSGDGPDLLIGGDGRDQLDAGAGNDVLVGTEGDAQLDVLAGGSGVGRVSYEDQPEAVRVDLAAHTATGRGIGTDALADVEDVRGGSAGDVLLGGAGPNVLIGGPGADTVRGRAGDDTLWGEDPTVVTGGFRDRIDGGPGNDLIGLPRGYVWEGDLSGTVEDKPDGRVDTVTCGGGVDGVSYAGPEDVLPASCERVSDREAIDPDGSWLRLPPDVASRGTFVLRASRFGGRPVIRAVTGRRLVLGRVAARVPVEVATMLRFTLTAAGRRLAARGRPVVVRVSGLKDGDGVPVGDLTVALPHL